MQKELLEPEQFTTAVETGEVVNKESYHKGSLCNCQKTTAKGSYRDVSVKMPDGRTIHYYHQSPVVVEKHGEYRLDSHGYRTSPTTKERINRYIPRGYKVVQRDYEWFVETPDGEIEFKDGMVIG